MEKYGKIYLQKLPIDTVYKFNKAYLKLSIITVLYITQYIYGIKNKRGNQSMRSVNKEKAVKLLTAFVLSVFLSSTISYALEYDRTFSDVTNMHWAYDTIERMVKKGVINGYYDGTFKPNNTVTYAQFIKMAVTAAIGEDLGIEKGGKHWAMNYYNKGLELGYYTELDIASQRLDYEIPRSDMALILSNYLGEIEIESGYYTRLERSLKDVDYTTKHDYHIIKAYSEGLITGYPDRTFCPEGTLKRSESAVVIERMLDETCREEPSVSKTEPKAFNTEIYLIPEGYDEGKEYELRKTSEFCSDFLDYPTTFGVNLFWTEDCLYYDSAENLNVKVSKDWEESNHRVHTFEIDPTGFVFVVKDGKVVYEAERPLMGSIFMFYNPYDFDYLMFVNSVAAKGDIEYGIFKRDGLEDFLVRVCVNPFK